MGSLDLTWTVLNCAFKKTFVFCCRVYYFYDLVCVCEYLVLLASLIMLPMEKQDTKTINKCKLNSNLRPNYGLHEAWFRNQAMACASAGTRGKPRFRRFPSTQLRRSKFLSKAQQLLETGICLACKCSQDPSPASLVRDLHRGVVKRAATDQYSATKAALYSSADSTPNCTLHTLLQTLFFNSCFTCCQSSNSSRSYEGGWGWMSETWPSRLVVQSSIVVWTYLKSITDVQNV